MPKSKFKSCPLCKHPALDNFYGVDCSYVWCRNYKEAAWQELQETKQDEDTRPQIFLPDLDSEPRLIKCLLCGHWHYDDSTCH